jgi:high-affinity Fe2+/Pb2+ permease
MLKVMSKVGGVVVLAVLVYGGLWSFSYWQDKLARRWEEYQLDQQVQLKVQVEGEKLRLEREARKW